MGKGPGKSSSNKPQHPNTNSPHQCPYIALLNQVRELHKRSKNSSIVTVIILLILLTFSLGNVLIQLGEYSCWSLLGLIGLTKGAFHLSQLIGQTIPVTTIISLLISQISQILNSMHERESLSAKTLRKSLFHFQTDWSGYGPAGQLHPKKNKKLPQVSKMRQLLAQRTSCNSSFFQALKPVVI